VVSRARRIRTVLALGGAAVLLAIWAAPEPARPTSAGERWGIDQLRVHRTAGGHMLDLRYRVVDPRRAASLLAEDGDAYLVHRRSGRRLGVPSTPKAGPLRNTGQPLAGRTYFVLFASAGTLVQRGDRVSVVLGDLTAELTVE